MDHPLSHTAAVVAGVAAVALVGCAALLLSDSRMLRSSTWWAVASLSGAVFAAAVIGYFRPRSRMIYLPVILSGLVTLGLCVLHLWWVLQPDRPERPARGVYKSIVFFALWLVWAGKKVFELRTRQDDDDD